MTLQRRLALTLVASAVPLVIGLAWVRAEVGRRAEIQVLREIVLARATALGRERCEAAPQHFFDGPPLPPRPAGFPRDPERFPRLPPGAPLPPGPGFSEPGPPRGPRGGRAFGFRPLEAFVYDASYQPQSTAAPVLSPSVRDALSAGRDVVTERASLETPGGPLDLLAVAMPTGWTGGPCTYVLVRRAAPPRTASLNLVASVIPLLVGLIAAVWVASGPLVRRVRTLTSAVKRSAAARYEVPVPVTGHDEITDLAHAFNEAGAEVRGHLATLERRDRTLREFLANTTHDVMIPLTVLQGHLSLLQRRGEDGATPDPATIVAAIKETQYMASLLHNLAAAAKLDAPEPFVQRHPVDLNALVERVVLRHRSVARPAQITIDYAVPDTPVVMAGDVTLLEQAVSNVVHNAVRYNHPGGHVAVVLDAGGDPGRFRLRIVDDGPGVSDTQLARLTERRFRDDAARAREPDGLGLGLSIARDVADHHGLTLRIARSEQGGLEVEFEGTTGSIQP